MFIPSINAIVAGFSAVIIFLTGYIIGFRLLAAMHTIKSKLLPWEAAFAMSLGSFYLGTVVSFVLLWVTGSNISPDVWGAWLDFSVTPVGISIVIYIGFSVLRPKFAKSMAIIYLLTGIPFWASLWFNIPEPSAYITSTPPELIHIALLSIASYLTLIYLVSLGILMGGGFISLARRSKGEIRTRSTYWATGIILFCIAGFLDSQIPVEAILLIVVRAVMVTSFLFLYNAMIPPKAEYYPSKVQAVALGTKRAEAKKQELS
ncbi:MAG TPA: hypothetical protein VKK79_12035 [Candidatus Lokiarchaeia archaeon]|nr:hypothetical protein [Candidatus Lokiarchaeia archaeon]